MGMGYYDELRWCLRNSYFSAADSLGLGATPSVRNAASTMTFTGTIGVLCMKPLGAIIRVCVRLRIHPNLLTLTGVLVNVIAAWQLAFGRFVSAGWIMIVANIFDFIDGKVARELQMESAFGGFWDSVMDRFSDITLFIGLIYLYAHLGRPDYVVITALAMMFSVMTSYTRARAESLIEKCKVGFMERPERIVLFMIGAFTNRMAAILWVVGVLSVVTVADRIHFTWRELYGSRKFEDELTAVLNRVS
jgi:CDP-diacylglycerol---glycerol-3-phosphate 3-phosphatidyltransferase